ncbi:YidH family protein [Bordetella genomosp. 12]|uniref:DUF202 domain-containing protein n=1 Tax=Bordetella genomosp. 12 TaxID=463035 RepID=A0A261VDR2_9BORD|nr:hypothetical protein CAL22_19150 [Bordetella genomosp. 12]
MKEHTCQPWYRQGSDPDYRFSLANERTFLAWVRTTLAFVAAAVVLDQIAEHAAAPTGPRTLALMLSVLGFALAAGAYFRWRANEVAMRHGRPLPVCKAQAGLAAGISLVAAAVTLWILRG